MDEQIDEIPDVVEHRGRGRPKGSSNKRKELIQSIMPKRGRPPRKQEIEIIEEKKIEKQIASEKRYFDEIKKEETELSSDDFDNATEDSINDLLKKVSATPLNVPKMTMNKRTGKPKQIYHRKWNRPLYVLSEQPNNVGGTDRTWTVIMENDLETALMDGRIQENDLLIYPRFTKAVKRVLSVISL